MKSISNNEEGRSDHAKQNDREFQRERKRIAELVGEVESVNALDMIRRTLLSIGPGVILGMLILYSGCSTTPSASTIAYQTIGASETAVLGANAAFLDGVVLGTIPTNNVPSVEAAFNDTQLALHTAAALASGGTNAPIPAMTNTKVVSFTNLVNSVKSK